MKGRVRAERKKERERYIEREGVREREGGRINNEIFIYSTSSSNRVRNSIVP